MKCSEHANYDLYEKFCIHEFHTELLVPHNQFVLKIPGHLI